MFLSAEANTAAKKCTCFVTFLGFLYEATASVYCQTFSVLAFLLIDIVVCLTKRGK